MRGSLPLSKLKRLEANNLLAQPFVDLQQATLIRQWRPWEENAGPKSPEGKATAACIAWQGRVRPLMRDLERVLDEQDKAHRQRQD